MIIPPGMEDYKRIRRVSDLDAFTPDALGGPDGVNAVVFERHLHGDFRAAASRIDTMARAENRTAIWSSFLRENVEGIDLSPLPGDERMALENIRGDLREMEKRRFVCSAMLINPNMHLEGDEEPWQVHAHADPAAAPGATRFLIVHDEKGTLLYRNEDTELVNAEEKLYKPLPGAKPFILEAGDGVFFLSSDDPRGLPLIHEGPRHDYTRATIMGYRKP